MLDITTSILVAFFVLAISYGVAKILKILIDKFCLKPFGIKAYELFPDKRDWGIVLFFVFFTIMIILNILSFFSTGKIKDPIEHYILYVIMIAYILMYFMTKNKAK